MKNKDRDAERIDLGNPLGLADQPITTNASDHVEGSSDPLQRRRRARALGEDGIEQDHSDLNVDSDAAPGIDVSHGGGGTEVSPRRR